MSIRALIAELMLQAAKQGKDLPVTVVKKGKGRRPEKRLNVNIFCSKLLKARDIKYYRYNTDSDIYFNRAFVETYETSCTKPQDESYKAHFNTYPYILRAFKQSKRSSTPTLIEIQVDQIEVTEAAKVLFGKGIQE